MNRLDKEEFVIGSISLLANKINFFGDGIFPDLTFKQWFLLLMIGKMDNKDKTLNSIAQVVGTSRQNVKKMLGTLEAKGYVSVEKSKRDRRALNIELTAKTFDFFAANNEATALETKKLFAPFSNEDLASFVKGLEKFLYCFELYERKG
ncbi:MAG: MarR family transcriptional regulator [Bacillota bacterium]|nr:MarR family transcriptional regulator [Bacillota bacterium]